MWTSEQKRAIIEKGCNILVSAGAGSGKTAVLTERVITHTRCNVHLNELLILTFTKAAAMEMKSRIRKALKKENNQFELSLLSSSYITTFDSFALSIVKRYHYILNIPKEIEITNESITKTIVLNEIDKLFEKRCNNKDKQITFLINKYCFKKIDELKEIIYYYYEKFEMFVYKRDVLNSYIKKFFDKENLNKLQEEFISMIEKMIEESLSLIKALENVSSNKVLASLKEIKENVYNAETINDKINFLNVELPRKNSDCLEEYSEIKKVVKENIKNVTSLYNDYCLNNNLVLNDLFKQGVDAIISILIELEDNVIKRKQNDGIYTFYDIAKKAIYLIKNNEEIRNELKSEFKEIMIDEYQDTSDVQEELISLISNNNVYMVGDVKQSIYGFRNANPSLFMYKYNSYYEERKDNNGLRINLTKNFRSNNEVVNTINNLFMNIMSLEYGGAEYSDGHAMIMGNNVYNSKPKDIDYQTEMIDYSSLKDCDFSKNEIEAFIVCQDIMNKVDKMLIYDKDQNVYRKANYSDFTILCDRESPFDTYKKVFEYHNVPLTLVRDEVMNKNDNLSIIKNIIKYITIVDNDDSINDIKYLYTSLARSFLFEIDDNEIFENVTQNKISSTLINNKIKDIKNASSILSTSEVVEKIIDDFEYIEKVNLIGNIEDAMSEVESILSLASSCSDIYELSSLLDDINKHDIFIKYSQKTTTLKAVKMMNIHKSKGLEFPVCYFVLLSSKFNDSDIKEKFIFDKNIGIIMPIVDKGVKNTFLKYLSKNNCLESDVSEKIRLLYVALTRTREKMIFLWDKDEMKEELMAFEPKIKLNSFFKLISSVYSKLGIKSIDAEEIGVKLDNDFLRLNKKKSESILENDKYKNINKISTLKVNHSISAKIDKQSFSKKDYEIDSFKDKEKKSLGTRIHKFLEMIDLDNINLEKIDAKKDEIEIIENMKKCFLFQKKYLNTYKEFEFVANDSLGIIDLLLEDEDCFYVVDYKSYNIDDIEYIKQVNGYVNYIKTRTSKKVEGYLYSLFEGRYKKV